MATTMFKDTTHTVFGLIEDIKSGEVALPDIQRPFVWSASKVRELIDSMYKGFPVGYLLFWDTGAEVGARQIGVGSKERVPRLLIVDGQQRLTSLYVVITGAEIIREDYSQGRIRIAFRPSDSTFAVTDAAIEKDPEFISDISKIWVSGERKNEVRTFKKRLREKRELSISEADALEEAIDRLHDIRDYPFKAVELNSSVDEELVAEVFVRINSAGVTLNQADFILTLMSVFWEKGRRDLEEFARNCKQPTLSQASPFNWYIQPTPAQLLRVTVGLAFRRAVLKNVYSLLRGKDVDTGKSIPERRDAQFAIMQKAHDKVLDITNWHEFLQCLERAGFRGSKMISSDNALLFSYSLWLIGRVEYGVPLDKLREVIARWFFMAHTTARYSGAFESVFEQDVARLSDVAQSDASGFISVLSKVVDDTFTADYWNITLPNELATSASKSPSLLAYIAALNILDADSLLSTGKVRSRLDPAITAKKGIERHHIFPRAYLSSVLKVQDKRDINQIANMALVEWSDNIAISDDAPTKYWPEQLAEKKLMPERLEQQMYWHALPQGWETMAYPDFLEARRRLMGAVVRDAFARLREQGYSPEYPEVNAAAALEAKKIGRAGFSVSVGDLLDADILQAGASLTPAKDSDGTIVATLLPDGKIALNDEIFTSLSGAGDSVVEGGVNGWVYWAAETSDGRFTMAALRELYLERNL
jgi:hypothetical protein